MYVCIYTNTYTHTHSFQNELKNMEDACDELLLIDDDENIPFFMGEVFIYHGMEQTQVQCKSFIIWNFCYISVLQPYGTSKLQDTGNLE
jgi:Prefoldin subunit.